MFEKVDVTKRSERKKIIQYLTQYKDYQPIALGYLDKLPLNSSQLVVWVSKNKKDEINAVVLKYLHRVCYCLSSDRLYPKVSFQINEISKQHGRLLIFDSNPKKLKLRENLPDSHVKSEKVFSYMKLDYKNFVDLKIKTAARVRYANMNDADMISTLLRETDMFPSSPMMLKIYMSLGRTLIAEMDGRITSALGTSVESKKQAMIDLAFTTSTSRGRGEFQFLGNKMTRNLVKEKKNIYFYTVHPAVKKLTRDLGYKSIGIFSMISFDQGVS